MTNAEKWQELMDLQTGKDAFKHSTPGHRFCTNYKMLVSDLSKHELQLALFKASRFYTQVILETPPDQWDEAHLRMTTERLNHLRKGLRRRREQG